MCEVAEDLHLKDIPIEHSQNIACGAASGGVSLNSDRCATSALLRRLVSCSDMSVSSHGIHLVRIILHRLK